ncbi:MAG: T9SS type A sorting domain-containing protein [Bacteroidia bacterium]
MRNLYLVLFCFLSTLSWSQWNNPYRITYDGSSYFVSNKGNGTVVEIDSNFATSTAISGLTSPNDIFFGTFAGTNTIAVIDTNQVKLYNAGTFASFINIAITGAVEAHDGLINPNNANEIFISDRAGNKIIKATVGAPPLYPITFSTLISNISKPAGMIIDSRGRLLVVSDTIDGDIHWIDMSTGYDSVVYSSNIDNLNDISQDNEGNFYVTSWGDDYVHRIDSGFTQSLKQIAFNNPSGMYVNKKFDYLAICCYNCNKVEYKTFHAIVPALDVNSCETDSFFTSFDPTYWGIGTYNSDNYFLLEVSDSAGNFTNALVIDSIMSDTIPDFFHTRLPKGTYADTGHLYRYRSTSPEVISFLEKDLFLTLAPSAFTYSADTVAICTGSSIVLGQAASSNHTYSWNPSTYLDDGTKANPLFSGAPIGSYKLELTETDTLDNCTAVEEVLVNVGPNLSIPQLADTLVICEGDSIDVGIDGLPYFFSWSGSDSLSNIGIGNPNFFDIQSRTLKVVFSDFSLTCAGNDSVYVHVNPSPSFGLQSGTIVDSSCTGVQKSFFFPLDQDWDYSWTSKNGDIDTTQFPLLIRPSIHPLNLVLYASIVSNSTGCMGYDSVFIKPLPLPFGHIPDNYSIYECAGDSLSLGFKLDSNITVGWPDFYFEVDTKDSSEPVFFSDDAVKVNPYNFVVTDENGCNSPENISVEFFYVPSVIKLDTLSYSSIKYISLQDQMVVNDLNAMPSTLTIQWQLNKADISSSSDTLGWFNRDDFTWGDTLSATIYRIVDGDTLCSFISDDYIKTNLGSIEALQTHIKIYPNPSKAGTILRIISSNPIDQIDVYSIDGKRIESEFNGELLDFETSSGVYLLRVKSGSSWYTKKLIIE